MSTEPIPVAAPASDLVERGLSRGMTVLILYSIGHFFIDLYSSALGSFQPLLVQKLGLTLTQAGIIGGALVFSSSLTQPAYGYLSDRFHTRLFSVLAPAVAGLFIAALGLAPSFGWAIALVLLGGAGIASFHPQASARATAGLFTRRGKWMAVFISSGTLGLAVGPTYFSVLVDRIGFERSYWGAIPGIIVTAILVFCLPTHHHHGAAQRSHFEWSPFRAVWKQLMVHYWLVVIRSTIQITFAQFLPLFLFRERGYTLAESNYALSLYLACGACGGFIGGHLADRFGGRKVILLSMVTCIPSLALFFFTRGPLSLVGLALGGLTLLFTIPVNVVMAQRLVPTQAGTVSALMMGFAWGFAGLIFIPLTGWLSDLTSMQTALSSLLIYPAIGAVLTLQLDHDH